MLKRIAIPLLILLIAYWIYRPRWEERGVAEIGGVGLDITFLKDGGDAPLLPFSLYALSSDIDPSSKDRKGFHVKVDSEGLLRVLRENRPGLFDLEVYSSESALEVAAESGSIHIPLSKLPDLPFKVWVGSRHVVRIQDAKIKPKRGDEITIFDPYNYILVTKSGRAA